jgi:dTDP-4-dehydrorhamnose reductase
VGGAERLSKYEFGLRLARRFGLDENLITPVSWQDQGLTAPRSPDLSLNSSKLAKALLRRLPDADAGVDGLYQQYQDSYPQRLRALRAQKVTV